MSTTAASGVEVAAIDTPALGDRSYRARRSRRAGHTVVAVDDEYARAARAGLPVDGHLAHVPGGGS